MADLVSRDCFKIKEPTAHAITVIGVEAEIGTEGDRRIGDAEPGIEIGEAERLSVRLCEGEIPVSVDPVGISALNCPADGRKPTMSSSDSSAASNTIKSRISLYTPSSTTVRAEPSTPDRSEARSAEIETEIGSEIRASYCRAARLKASSAAVLLLSPGPGTMLMLNVPRLEELVPAEVSVG